MPVTAYPCIDSGTSVLALVHDAWAPYDTCRQAGDQLFTVHLAREPTAVIDHHHAANEPGSWCWATQALDALTPVERAWKEHPDGRGTKPCRPGDEDLPAEARHLITSAAAIGAAFPVPGALGDKHRALGDKHRALARRLNNRVEDHHRFTTAPGATPDNSAAERETRMLKVRQKTSGCFRTPTGAQTLTRIRSYLHTARKHSHNPLDALTALTTGHTWLPT